MHFEGAVGAAVVARYTALADSMVKAIYSVSVRNSKAESPHALVALGGYGREELCFNSDLDIMLLHEGRLNRKLEAEIAVSMERKQKGEQFRVIDPATIPRIPVKPDMRKVVLLSLVIGLGLGGGLAYLTELTDTSFKMPQDLESAIGLPVLVSLPFQHSESELRRMRKWKVLTVATVAIGFLLSAIVLVLAIKGVDNTLGFLKNIIQGS